MSSLPQSRNTPRYRRLRVDPVGGVAGDMLLAALFDLGAPAQSVERALASLGIDGLMVRVEAVELDGVAARYVRSIASADVPQAGNLAEVNALLDRCAMPECAARFAGEVFSVLASAEAEAHRATPESVHFHEVGQLDSIMDVVGIAVAVDELGVQEVSSSPLPSGGGTVETRHGRLRCPVPAVQAVARRFSIPLIDVAVQGETITPTGIAALAVMCERFDASRDDDEAPDRVGIGAGSRRFPDCPNILRLCGWK